jgi:GAF domain-containing protein/HAMP domain-containing protein
MARIPFLSNIFNSQAQPGRLARSIIRTLLLFTFIPLIVMAGLTYLRTQNMLRTQVVTQMQNLVTTDVNAAKNAIRVKQIRLDRVVRRADFASALNVLLTENTGSPAFTEARNKLISIFEEINREEGTPIFNAYFIADEKGEILAASDQDWEMISIAYNPLHEDLQNADNQSFGVFDFTPFYPGQFSLVTIDQYSASNGTARATVVGLSDEQYALTILNSIVDLTPSSRAYFVSDHGGFIGLNSYTSGMQQFESVEDQKNKLDKAFALTMDPNANFVPSTVTFRNDRGENVIAQAIWVEELHSGVVLEVPTASILGYLYSLIIFTAVIILVTGVFLVVTISASANRVVKPIIALADTTSQFAAGKWDQRAAVQGNDEVGLLATSFNHMADQLSQLYHSLEDQVEERTHQIRAAAEVAQGITSSFNLDELLQTTVKLIVDRFGFYHAGIFMIDSSGTRASLRAAYGPTAEEMMKRGHQHEVGSDSIVGWASANLKPRVASDVNQDAVYWKNPLLPNTRAEAGFPIALGEIALGVLDVQSTEPHVFDEEMVIVLQTLANQIAAAIQNTTLNETAKMDASDAEKLYRACPEIAQAESEKAALDTTARVMKEAPNPSIVMRLDEKGAEVVAVNNPIRQKGAIIGQLLNIKPQELVNQLRGPILINDLNNMGNLPASLARPLREIGCKSGAFLPVQVQGQPAAIIMIGEQPGQPLTSLAVQSYTGITGLLSAVLEKIQSLRDAQLRLNELEALATFSQAAFSASDVKAFYENLQAQVQRVIGNYSFLVALYDAKTNSISIPYLYEEGRTQTIEPFPLGEGLTSVLIHTRRPLLLVEDTEKQAMALGAKIHGKPAKSWMGVPLLIQNDEPIGALVIQDLERDHCFNERDLHFLNELGKQMAGMIQNIRLLEQSQKSALQLQTAAEIARDISGSLELDELLLRGVNLIRDRFSFYHASIFLVDPHNQFAIIREATGEAGAQLKRMGHKLAVGSKSIVGYVTGQGDVLVVNDALKDATYYANPILPDTRSEAAIPLKVGERILGALDVQSTQPYAFNEENLRTLEILADQLAVAVVNTELFAETQEHLSQHRLLHHITTSAASGSTLEDALDTTVKGLQVTLGGDRVSILLLNKERKVLEMRALMGYSEEAENLVLPINTGITGWAATHRKTLRVDDVTKDPRYITVSENTRSEMALPLLYRNELLGVLNVESEQIAAYTENDEEMLGTLAGSLAAVIANARLLAQIRRQAERERMLYEVTSKIRRSTDMQSILATTASELARAIGARHTHIKLEVAPNGESSETTVPTPGGANG